VTVVDASVWISSLLPDDVNHEASRSWFEQLASDEELLAPMLLLVEISAGLARRTGRLDVVQHAIVAVRANPRLTIRTMSYDLMEAAVDLAARLRLRAGDAIYVALAHLTGTRLVSWDREQRDRSASVVRVSSPADHLGDSS
jgi:predicted nucleic acid-binding protein